MPSKLVNPCLKMLIQKMSNTWNQDKICKHIKKAREMIKSITPWKINNQNHSMQSIQTYARNLIQNRLSI